MKQAEGMRNLRTRINRLYRRHREQLTIAETLEEMKAMLVHMMTTTVPGPFPPSLVDWEGGNRVHLTKLWYSLCGAEPPDDLTPYLDVWQEERRDTSYSQSRESYRSGGDNA